MTARKGVGSTLEPIHNLKQPSWNYKQKQLRVVYEMQMKFPHNSNPDGLNFIKINIIIPSLDRNDMKFNINHLAVLFNPNSILHSIIPSELG